MPRPLVFAALLILPLLAALMADRAFPPAIIPPVGTELVDRNTRLLAVLPAPGGVWRLSPGDVSPAFTDELIRTEDRRFWYHPGVDPISLARAAVQALRTGRIVSGGSTLTMQVVRLLEPRPRTLRSKLIEIARALQLEAHHTKPEILRLWLTLAPYGGNLQGVRAASLAWFGVPPAQLDPAQSALLVAIPRRPEALRPDRHPAAARLIRDRIFASDDPVPDRRLPMPATGGAVLRALGQGAFIRTTLDLPLQQALERLAADRLRDLPPRVSLALLVADLPAREIRAIVGGAWGSEPRAGALDLTQALRSPGSTLKPFLYAMAFEDGLVTPQTRITDLPRHFGVYAPENLNGGHAGRVTVADALRQSLNLPAVALLDQLGPARFAATLRAAGAHLVLPAGAEPSLPLALGGVGITLRDLAALYAALATNGIARPLALLPAPAPAHDFLAPEAARLTADVLTQPFPAGGPAGVAWKTGTSWGGRDVWSFGFDQAHLAAVWVGRPDGTPMPGATSRDLALPILSRLFDLLPPSPRSVSPMAAPRRLELATTDTLRLIFPPPGATLSADGPVPLRAIGGQRPLSFLVDGAPIPAEAAQRQATWQPAGPGFYSITVLDAGGEAARASVRVR